MAAKTILRMGESVLNQVAAPVTCFATPELRSLVEDMFDSMRAAGGVGLAAPQIGVGLQVVIFGFERSARYPEAEPVPLTVLINPQITPVSDEESLGWEGCLSVPGLRGEVPRYQRIRYTGFDPEGAVIERTVDGFHARVVQHECDHLLGRLFPSRVRDFHRFGFTEVLFPERAAAKSAGGQAAPDVPLVWTTETKMQLLKSFTGLGTLQQLAFVQFAQRLMADEPAMLELAAGVFAGTMSRDELLERI